MPVTTPPNPFISSNCTYTTQNTPSCPASLLIVVVVVVTAAVLLLSVLQYSFNNQKSNVNPEDHHHHSYENYSSSRSPLSNLLTIPITIHQAQVKIRTRDFQAAHQVAQRLPVLSLVVTHINENVIKRIQLGSALTKLSRGFVRLCQSKPARLTTLGPLPSPPSLRKGRGGDLLPSLPHSTPSLRSGKNEGGNHPL